MTGGSHGRPRWRAAARVVIAITTPALRLPITRPQPAAQVGRQRLARLPDLIGDNRIHPGGVMRRLSHLVVLVLAMLGLPATAVAAPPETGQFPIEEHIAVFEPESSVCGFPISVDLSGQGTFQVFFDADGNPTGAHVTEVVSGGVSANGITLVARSANNLHFDFTENTVMETGIVFQELLPGTGVVLMDRGRWSGTSTRKPVR
jgi:hypothetical protein